VLTSRYMTSVKNLPAIMQKITEGTAPEKFTQAHLKGIGFKSSNDQGVIPLLKELGYLTPDGAPTQRYLDYRNKSQSRRVMGEAIHEAYEDLFHINERPSESDRLAIMGKFKSHHNVTDRIAAEQARTFYGLLELADLNGDAPTQSLIKVEEPELKDQNKDQSISRTPVFPSFGGLRYNIEIHLPPTKDVEVYNAIFKSLKEHLIDD
jgi:hypothetical protein